MIWRCGLEDLDAPLRVGMRRRQVWFARENAAHDYLRITQDETAEDLKGIVESVVVPTSRHDLVAWLNENFTIEQEG